jgi:hypothetical protein
MNATTEAKAENIEAAYNFVARTSAERRSFWGFHPSRQVDLDALIASGRVVHVTSDELTPDDLPLAEKCACGSTDLALSGYWLKEALIARLRHEAYDSRRQASYRYHKGSTWEGVFTRHADRLEAYADRLES